jgi:hypothetical protein
MRAPLSTVEPSAAAIQSAAATTLPLSPVSNVKGVAFDRIVQIWLENTNYNVRSSISKLPVSNSLPMFQADLSDRSLLLTRTCNGSLLRALP